MLFLVATTWHLLLHKWTLQKTVCSCKYIIILHPHLHRQQSLLYRKYFRVPQHLMFGIFMLILIVKETIQFSSTWQWQFINKLPSQVHQYSSLWYKLYIYKFYSLSRKLEIIIWRIDDEEEFFLFLTTIQSNFRISKAK